MPTIRLSVDANTDIKSKALYYLFMSAIYFTAVGIIAVLGLLIMIIAFIAIFIDTAVEPLGTFLFGFIIFFGPYYYFYHKLKGMQQELIGKGER